MLKILIFLLAFALTPSLQAQTINLAGTGTVSYELIHKFHKVVGTSPALVARGTVDATGLKAMARAQVATFDSGNTNRDAHMMEAVEGAKYPYVSVRMVAPNFTLPTAPVTVRTDAEVELHGISVRHPIDLQVTPKGGNQYQVRFSFTEKLTEHKIKRPSLLLVPVEDDLKITGEVQIQAKP
jgi:hypothetical protein